MSFWDDIVQVVTAPVTLPAKVFSNVLNNVAPSNKIANSLSNTFSAPFDFFQGGKLSLSKAQTALNQATPGLQIAGAISGGALGSAVGFDSSGLSDVTGLLGNTNSGAVMNPVRSGITNEVGAPATPFRGPPGFDWTPVVLVGGAAILGLLLFGRK